MKGHICAVETFGSDPGADLRASDETLISGPGWLGVQYHISGKRTMDIRLDMPGLLTSIIRWEPSPSAVILM